MEIKIAHCADIHIGAKMEKLGKFSDIRRSEIKNTFFNMIEIIKKNNVDIVLVAGDLFHDINIYSSDINDVKNAFGSLDSKVFVAPGNHDPFVLGSPYYGEWPDNVYIFKSNFITNFEITELKTRVWGSAFTDSNNSGVKIDSEIIKNDDFINILVTHGTCPSSADMEYNPINIVDICNSNMNYVALGHIHKRTEVIREGDVFYSYPGCIEGRSFKETGEKGFYLGTISNKSCDLKFVRVCKRVYVEFTVDITGIDNSEDICSVIIDKMKGKCGSDFINDLYRIYMIGTTHKVDSIDKDYIKSKLLDEVFYVEIYDNSNIDLSEESETLEGTFIKNMNGIIERANSDEEKEIAENALKLGVMSFYREVLYDDN